QKSETYISRPGAAEADRAYFLSAPMWREKHVGVQRQGSVHRTVGGGVVVQSFARLTAGMPVTLEGDDRHGLMFVEEAAKLAAMMAEGVALEFSDDDGTTKHSVVPDWSREPLDQQYLDGYYKQVMRGTVYLLRV
ncbi:hypothetical protein M0R72_06750, partial [Candidatus Pacearchaeota archaeon]|nr:hypothetical protein [Candidatus Pacearchaeota archaeon]